MESLRQRRLLSSITLKRRKSWLLAASALASSSLGISGPALAVCTQAGVIVDPTAIVGNATCTGTFTNNIIATDSNPLTLTDVIVNSPGGVAIGVASGVGAVSINADTVTINNAGSGGLTNTGLAIAARVGDATITTDNTSIRVAGPLGGGWAINAHILNDPSSAPHNVLVNYTQGTGFGLISGFDTNPGGNEEGGIHADNHGTGNATINANGNVNVFNGGPNFAYGILAHAGDTDFGAHPRGAGNASITYSGGTINVIQNVAPGGPPGLPGPRGILAWIDGVGSATVNTDPGTTIRVVGTPFGGPAVFLFSSDPTAHTNTLTANVASTIESVGPAIREPGSDTRPVGIRANNSGSRAQISINYTGPGITTQGSNGIGILAQSGGGSININSSGPITTNGYGAHGVVAGLGGLVQITAADVTTKGEFSTAINATGNGNVTVNVASGGSVMGGWQADLGSAGVSWFSLPSAGVILSSTGGTATLTNDGSIGALSDRAVASSLLFPSNNTSIINNGTITGFVQLVGDNNSFVNNGLFNLRHFADTTGATDASGNGVRDTVRVAIADLGPGVFTNNGTLALPAVTGATTLDSTGQYLPLDNPNNNMALGGPLQGQLLGVTTFTNSGTIDLQQNPAAGDVLLITGGHTPGANGGGTYISNGGFLKLDTVLNEGGAATRSDTLVVDGTSVGAGPTQMAIRNAGGGGALTVGDGILVTQVLDPTRSAPGAFSLQGGPITAGAFDYFLFKGGPSPGSEGNWYLRSSLVPGGTPAPGEPPFPTLAPGAAPIPLFQPGVAVMSVVPSVARSLGLLTLGTFNERQGDQLLVRGGCSRETQDRLWNADKGVTRDENCTTKIGAWGRVFGQNTREHFAQGARPDFDGTFAGFQVGADLWRLEGINGHRDNIGFYVAQARASGSVHGLVDGFAGALAGHVGLDASSYGGYWTHLGPSNWYIDTVVQGTHFFGTPQSIRGVSTTVNGDAFTGSIEAGYPITLAPWLSFEPQIQGIWQRVWLGQTLVPFSTISFDRADVFTGRAGALLRGTFGSTGGVWQPYLKGNVWWGSNGFDTVSFNGFGIPTGRNGGTTLEGGGGVAGRLTRNVSVYGDASYLTSVSGESHIALKGNVGLRVTW